MPTPKSAKSTEPKAAKSKSKKEGKTGGDKKADKEAQVPKEPELSPAEKHQRKEASPPRQYPAEAMGWRLTASYRKRSCSFATSCRRVSSPETRSQR